MVNSCRLLVFLRRKWRVLGQFMEERKSRRMQKSGLIDPKYSRVQFYLFAKLIQCHWINSAPTDKRWTLGLTLSENIIGFSGSSQKGRQDNNWGHTAVTTRGGKVQEEGPPVLKRVNSRWLVDEDVVCSGAWVIQLAGDLVRVATKEAPERVYQININNIIIRPRVDSQLLLLMCLQGLSSDVLTRDQERSVPWPSEF